MKFKISYYIYSIYLLILLLLLYFYNVFFNIKFMSIIIYINYQEKLNFNNYIIKYI